MDNIPMISREIDRYLSACVQPLSHCEPLPEWPESFSSHAHSVLARIAFHGIAPLLCEYGQGLPGWPAAIALPVKREAALHSFWESSHCEAISHLLKSFDEHDIPSIVTKGTAIAYSLYPKPDIRQRGDTDILLGDIDRERARDVLRLCGYIMGESPRPLQEDWHRCGSFGFTHTVDIHWRISSSAAVSQMLERSLTLGSGVPLPNLHRTAKAMEPVGNLILTCVNRASHDAIGYWVGTEKIFAPDRLIWALDIYLFARSFDEQDWQQLIDLAEKTQTASIVRSGLEFARQVFSNAIPEGVMETLDRSSSPSGVETYFATSSGVRRLGRDFSASGSLREKIRILRHAIFANATFLRERFPDAQGWPVPVLQAQRWVAGAVKLTRRDH